MEPAAIDRVQVGCHVRAKLLNVDPPLTYAVVLQTGDEVISTLNAFVREQEVEAASLTAIGAFSKAVLGYFEWESKQYRRIPVDEQVELLSLLGDVAIAEAYRPYMSMPYSAGPMAARSAGTCWKTMCGRRWRRSLVSRRATCANARTPKPGSLSSRPSRPKRRRVSSAASR
jgi:hypothetical protein